jgi:hypothetical protein
MNWYDNVDVNWCELTDLTLFTSFFWANFIKIVYSWPVYLTILTKFDKNKNLKYFINEMNIILHNSTSWKITSKISTQNCNWQLMSTHVNYVQISILQLFICYNRFPTNFIEKKEKIKNWVRQESAWIPYASAAKLFANIYLHLNFSKSPIIKLCELTTFF